MKVRVATRRSKLALTQMRQTLDALRALEPALELEEVWVETRGDRIQDRPLAAIGGKGLFVREVEHALLDGRADLAVHSLKDIPGDEALPEGLSLVCIPERQDARDWLLTPEGIELDDLPAGARVGTGSLRRICQLRSFRNDLDYRPLRGNVDTRLARLDAGDYDAIVLAAAGLKRLGLADRPHWPLPPSICLPAVGQGALALELRDDAPAALRELLTRLEHAPSRIAIEAERTLLTTLQGNCHSAIGALARIDERRLRLDALVADPHSGERVRNSSEHFLLDNSYATALAAARQLGQEVATTLIDQGAQRLLNAATP